MFLLADCSYIRREAETILAPPPVVVAPSPPAALESGVASQRPGERPRPEAPEIITGREPPRSTLVPPPTAALVQPSGDIMLKFVDADVHEVASAVLGRMLQLNYAIDPGVQGTITVETSRGIPRDAVLPTFEAVLRSNGLALLADNGLYRIVSAGAPPAREPAAAAPGGPSAIVPGQAVRVLPLRYGSAAEMKKVIDPFVPPSGGLQVDPGRNLLLLSGTREEIDGIAQLVGVLDVDWLAGRSFGLYPLHSAIAKELVPELDKIFNPTASSAAGTGALRFLPIERINAVLVIAAQATALARAGDWIDRLDRGGDENRLQVYVYYLQNARSSDLGPVLSELIGGGNGGSRSLAPLVAPGQNAVEMQSLPGATGATGGSAFPSSSDSPQPLPAAASASPGTSANRGRADSSFGATASPAIGSESDLADYGARRGTGASNGPGASGTRIVADEKNNALVIYALPRDYRVIEGAIRKLDIVPLQVMIEATIAEVTLNDQLQYGLQWFFKTGTSSFRLTNDASGVVAPMFPGFSYVLAGTNAQVVLSALSQITKVNVISSPQLLVLDHQAAFLQVGDQVPIATQQQQSVLTTGSPVINTIQYKDTGVILRVTPRVNASGMVLMDVSQEVSDVAKTTTSGLDSPTIQQRRIVSTVAVQGGESVALGGLIRDSQQQTRSGIPFLSDVPVLGFLFRTDTNTGARTELLVMLTPRIVRNNRDAQAVTDELRARLRAIEPLTMRTR